MKHYPGCALLAGCRTCACSYHFNHSVLIDWPWRTGYLIVCDLGVYEVFYDDVSMDGGWIEKVLASL